MTPKPVRSADVSCRQLLGVLRRPVRGGARDGRGRPDRRPHRRLPGRADHGHLVAQPGARSGERIRHDLPQAGGGDSSRHASSGRFGWSPNAGGLAPAVSGEQAGGVDGAARGGCPGRSCRRRRPDTPDTMGWDRSPISTRRATCHPASSLSPPTHISGAGVSPPPSDAGADVVVTGRVTDAALVMGPAAWKFGWGPDDLDALAGALVAGHVIECGAQCTGGNFSFFDEIPAWTHPGFPLVEVEPDGSFVVTKHPGTGGRGHRGDGHRPTALRDRRTSLPQPGRHGALRHDPSCRRRPGSCPGERGAGRATAADGQVGGQLPRGLQEHGDIPRPRARHRGEGAGRPRGALGVGGGRGAGSPPPR